MSDPIEVGKKKAAPPSDTVNVASIGVGSMGIANIRTVSSAGARIAAICDVDETQAKKVQKYYPDAVLYADYRRLLEKEKGVDAVIVSTPNHTHAVISMAAMQLGKHVYCEKPLAHTMHEVRRMAEAAREYKVATQLGNQGHSYETNREVHECIRSGTIGQVREVHLVEAAFNFSLIGRMPDLSKDHPVPETLDWDQWLGPAPYRKFNPAYHPAMWRCFRQFSSGMIGDFFCHAADPVFWALDLDAPTSAVADAEGYDPQEHSETFPKSSRIRFEFPAQGHRPALTLYWYDGKAYVPPRPEELEDGEDTIPALGPGAVGGLVIGDRGKIIYGSHGAADWRLIPKTRMDEYLGGRTRAGDPRPGGFAGMPNNLAHHQDWLRACKGGDPANSDFVYGGRLTEIAVLGDIAQQMPGTELVWDAGQMAFPNQPEADRLLHYQYRDGWSL